MNRSLIAMLCILSAGSILYGQEVTVSARFDTSRVLIGDQFHYTVTIDKPDGIHLNIKTFRDTLCKNIEILGGPVLDSMVTSAGRVRIKSMYLVTSFDSGFYQVPPVYAEIKDPAGIRRFYSEYTPLEVMRAKMAPPDSAAKIFDIIKPYKAPVTLGEILPYLLIGILALAAIWGIVILVRKYMKPKGIPEPAVNPDPAHVIAFRDLEELQREQLWQKGEVKQFYSRLTEIIRQYLENRFAVYSLEMTTSETLEALLKTGFRKDESYNILRTVLNGSDLVKFAKYKPDPSENENHFSGSWKFVEATLVKEELVANDVKEKRS